MRLANVCGIADIIVLCVIAGCLIVGGAFMFFSDRIDHPIEQMAEDILEQNGFDVDFSADKKADE